MRLNIPPTLGSVLDEYLDKFPHKKKLRQGMVLSVFEKVVGSRMAEQVEEIYFKDDDLILMVSHASWRHEIHANRFGIAKKLNQEIKGDVVKNIIVKGR